MSSAGASMQNYLTDLIQNLESMKLDRTEIQEEINQSEAKKTEIEENIAALSARLKVLNESLEKKTGLRQEYDSNIQEISTAFTVSFHLMICKNDALIRILKICISSSRF